jgi:hypothetical protein
MKTIKQTLLGFALSVFSITAVAQCPTSVSLSVTSNPSNGNLTVTQLFNVTTASTTAIYNAYNLYGSSTNYFANSFGANGIGSFTNIPTGTYSLCINDSVHCGGFFTHLYDCIAITITNTVAPAPCNVSFTYYTDSMCITHFVNTTTGTNLSYDWYINGTNYSTVDPSIGLPNGSFGATLVSYSNGLVCDSMYQNVSVACNGGSTVTPTSCMAHFQTYTDSLCNTHFVNSSTGLNLSYDWYINGVNYTSSNPILSLANGTYNIMLFNYSNGSFCDSINSYITVSCNPSGTVIPGPCNASFYSYTDSLCNTYFTNTSTGSNINSYWLVDGTYYSGYDQILPLTNGLHNVSLYNYSNGFFCDSTTQMINIACNSGTVNPTACQANSSFIVFADSTNSGNYFAYNMSSGTGVVSYGWDFGDGTTSTQQYPFHQYALSGHYIVCLTITATNGTTTCTDSYCDSSSVQRVAAGFLMHRINVIAQVTTGVKENTLANGLKMYPNPIINELTIEIEFPSTISNYTYAIIDALGKVVMKNDLKDSKTVINTSGLDNGFYFLSISTLNGKVIKTSKLAK